MATYTITTTSAQDAIIDSFIKALSKQGQRFNTFQDFLDNWFAALMEHNKTLVKNALVDDIKEQLSGLNPKQLQRLLDQINVGVPGA